MKMSRRQSESDVNETPKKRARLMSMEDTGREKSREERLKKVRRRLNFGGSEPEDTKTQRDDLEEMIDQERKSYLREKSEKWNFDFDKEVPLEGRWEWERVPKSTAPPQSPSQTTYPDVIKPLGTESAVLTSKDLNQRT